jgi:hypothetical protein
MAVRDKKEERIDARLTAEANSIICIIEGSY